MKTLKYITLFIFLLGSLMGLQAQELTPLKAQNGKWGMKNKSGTIVVKAEYDYINEFKEGFARVYKNDLFGFMDNTGKIVIPLKYELAYDFSDGMALVSKGCEWFINKYQESECSGGVWGYINKKGEEIAMIYEQTTNFSEGLAAVKLNNKFGYIDQNAKVVIPIKYDQWTTFKEGMALVKLNEKYGWIDQTGKEVIPIKYDEAGYFSEGLAAVRTGDKWAYINTSGETVTPFIFQEARVHSTDGLARAKKDDKWGFIDKNCKEVIPFIYDYANPMEEGYALVKKDNKFGVIDTKGKELCPVKYDSIGNFIEGVAMMNIGGSKNEEGEFSGGLWGIIAKNGSEIVPPSFPEISDNYASQTLLYFQTDKKYGFLNKKTGKQILPAMYQDFSYSCNGGSWGKFFDDGLLAVRKNDYWGMIDTAGKEVIPIKYDEIHEFKEGLAAVGFGGKESDKSLWGTSLIPVNNFRDSKYGFIDRKGNIVIPCIHDQVYWVCNHDAGFYGGLAAVQQKGKWGFIDKSGKIKIPFKYDGIIWGTGFMDNERCGVELDGRQFYVDKNGKEIKE